MRIALIICLLLGAISCRSPKEAEFSGLPFVAYVGATVIDGKGNPPKENQVILVQDNEIVRIGNKRGFQYPANTRLVNCQSKYIIPGLIDMHAHVTVLPLEDDGSLSRSFDLEASLASLQTYIDYGVTTVRNPAAPTRNGVFLRALSEEDTTYRGPRILTAGAALNWSRANFGPFVSTRTSRAIRHEIQQQAEAGVDYIKIYAGLKPSLAKEAIQAAHLEGLEVIGHLQATSWTEAIKLGIDAITHAAPWHEDYLEEASRGTYSPSMLGRLDWLERVNYDGPEIQEMIQLMADSQVVIDPTLLAFKTKFWGNDSSFTHGADTALVHPLVLEVWRNGTFVDDWTEEDFGRAQSLWPKLIELTKRMYDKGALLTVGTDFPNPWVLPGKGLIQEMLLLEEAGISRLEVIKAATYNGALALHLEDQVGALGPGLKADFVVLNEDPLKDLSNLEKIEMVIKGGKKM
ncbi:MAG: amidohydrolase family protein [Bacteroidia bacterium]|nr:amidohydrolase family protein [Bacteroidia bacterium]